MSPKSVPKIWYDIGSQRSPKMKEFLTLNLHPGVFEKLTIQVFKLRIKSYEKFAIETTKNSLIA